jgi:hypothetical protein
MKGRDHSKETGIDWRIILKWILRNKGRREWIELIWLRIGTGGRLLRAR